MSDQRTIEQARFIFTTGKLLRRHMFSSLANIETDSGGCGCSDLSLAQFNLLMAVQALGKATGVELAAQLGVSPPSISVMVERLVERGLLIRERSSEDRRKVLIRMSSEEAVHFSRMEEMLLASFVHLVEEVGEETAAKWVEVLQQVELVLRRQFDQKTKGQSK